MKYLKVVQVRGETFFAQFTSGATTASHDAACYFQIMTDKGIAPSELDAHIKLGEMVDSGHDWAEIRRIATTFTGRAAA